MTSNLGPQFFTPESQHQMLASHVKEDHFWSQKDVDEYDSLVDLMHAHKWEHSEGSTELTHNHGAST